MKGTLGWRLGAALVAALCGLAAMGVGHWAAVRAERDAARRAAQSAAAYLAYVAPPASGSPGYDLSRLLGFARGINTMSGWTGAVEVFLGTAPLIRTIAAPLPAERFGELQDREAATSYRGFVLVPLKDRDDWDVVGAVAVRQADIAPDLLGVWELVILALLAVTGALAVRLPRGGTVACVLAAVLAGLSGYRQVVVASRRATDQWLGRARMLIDDAGSRAPPRTAASLWPRLSTVAREGELVASDSGPTTVRRVVLDG
ncbi:MAG TPA: hypothetical protein VJ816_01540, partial [Gemmatimonadales bacterium]|nr:hypothetical protein [Gemmatimonadales bacterium]